MRLTILIPLCLVGWLHLLNHDRCLSSSLSLSLSLVHNRLPIVGLQHVNLPHRVPRAFSPGDARRQASEGVCCMC